MADEVNEASSVASAPVVEPQDEAPVDATIAAETSVDVEPAPVIASEPPVVQTVEEKTPQVVAEASPVETSAPAPEVAAEQIVEHPVEATNDSPWPQASATLAAKQEEVPAALPHWRRKSWPIRLSRKRRWTYRQLPKLNLR